ncbi:hypothetical protein SAMN02799630_03607 [Paenibacillus sp. UNCCL117]|uniref:hypothetical protein n=1 Tax=unclassified Paenibacillus TaxID=185978 RepID=UPI00088304E2|nr:MULTISPECIES: hypothetical protein [unclassified Paenibacillus]SDD37549.1 hypothetical protein SAMN04488602_10812 [Paenibacillus sp. cl123]SFW48761.1 hypothetical protein SAMN02799630_03607 [Paenibacillus sp. UNCCL117]
MLRLKFKDWMESKIPALTENFVSTEFIKPAVDERLIALPFTKVLHESENCLGQLVVYESGKIEYEIVSILSGDIILWKYFEYVSANQNFDEMFDQYFEVLYSGLKPK